MVGLAAAIHVVASALGQSPLAATLAGAVVADLGGSRAGVQWADPAEADGDDTWRAWRRALQRVALGAGVAAAAAAGTLGIALALGWASAALGQPSWTLALALLRAAAAAVRDEILLSGIPLATAARAGLPASYAVVFAALAHGAAVALVPGAGGAAVPLAIALGALAAALWRRHGGLAAAVSAVATFGLLTGAGLRGSLLDVTWPGSVVHAGARASGPAAWLAAAVLTAIAVLIAFQRRGESG